MDRPRQASANYQRALEITKRLALMFPTHPGIQRDLTYSYDMIGNRHSAAGQWADALIHYQKGLTLSRDLAKR